MKKSKLLLLAILILPWLTIPFFGRDALKKYFPSATFMMIVTKIIDVIGKRKKWWRAYKGVYPLDSLDILNFGPYFVTTLWILKMTYGKFLLYLFCNTILHILFIYVGLKYISDFKILALKKLSKFQYLLIDSIRALLLYGFQLIKDNLKVSSPKKNKDA